MGLMVRLLPRRASTAGGAFQSEHRFSLRPRLQGRSRRGSRLARPERRSLHSLDRRSRRTRGHRLRRVRRPGDFSHRQVRSRALQADRTDYAGSLARQDPAAGARAAAMTRFATAVALALIAALAGAAKMEPPSTEAALDARLKRLETELRCLVCQ